MLDLVGDPVGDLCQKIVGDAGPVGGHEVVGGDGTDGQEVVVELIVLSAKVQNQDFFQSKSTSVIG